MTYQTDVKYSFVEVTTNVLKIAVLESEGELKQMIRKEDDANCAKVLFILFKIKRKEPLSFKQIEEEHQLPQELTTHFLNEYLNQGLSNVLNGIRKVARIEDRNHSYTRYRQVLNLHLDEISTYEEASTILREYFNVDLSFNDVFRLFLNYYGLPLHQIKEMMKDNKQTLLMRI